MNFDDYLISKKIDAEKYRVSAPDQYENLANIFRQVSPKSFTDQKLFLINGIRRMYPLPVVASETKIPPARPKINIPKK